MFKKSGVKKNSAQKTSFRDCLAVTFYKTKLAMYDLDTDDKTHLLSKYIAEREDKTTQETDSCCSCIIL